MRGPDEQFCALEIIISGWVVPAGTVQRVTLQVCDAHSGKSSYSVAQELDNNAT
jgi:hypothetical protein